jgi:PAS domain S-box-containing protein
MKTPPARSVIIQVVLLAGVLPWLLSLAAYFAFGSAQHVHERLHEGLELIGSCTALAVAMLLWLRSRQDKESPHLLWVAAALVAMGLVDAAHALAPSGVAWSWLRHGATLVGGVLFGLIWLPLPAFAIRRKQFFMLTVAALAIAGSLGIWWYPDILPAPWGPGGYTFAVKTVNVFGGLGFLAAALYFFRRYLRHPHPESLVFASQSLLFGVASLLFGYSHVWAADWWVWHGCRLLAYAVVLLAAYEFVIKLYQQIVRDGQELEARTVDLRRASLYARSLLEASLDPLVTISREGKITDVNEATETATGIPRDRLIGSDFSDYFTDPEKARQGYRLVFEERSVRDYPLAIRHASGQVMEVLYNASVFKNEAGEVEGVFAAARDITRRKQAEDEVRKLNRELEERVHRRTAQLHESEQRVRRKLESILSPEGDLGNLELADILDVPAVQAMAEDLYHLIPIPAAIIDLKGNFLVAVGLQEICSKFHRANPESCRNCIESDVHLTQGVAPGEFRSYKCKNNMWDVVTPILVAGEHLANLFTGQFFFADDPPDYESFRAQAKRYGFDEKEYLAALDKAPRLTREQLSATMSFFMKFAQLLSQMSYSSVKLARSMTETTRVNAQLEASVKELEAFTYSVSHDLRAPLRHISGFSKILTEEFGSSLPEDAQHHLHRIQEGTRRMGVLVDDLLNLARVGRRDLSMRITGLNSLVNEVIAELKPEMEGRNVEWRLADLPFVECDSGLMKQVLQNLLANALKFTRPRAQAIIEVGQQEQNGTTLIYVRDNGVGFSMKYADKLFGVFQRLHRPEDFEGTGVGLATVQRIIQKHGGRTWAEAELDKGAIFYFTIGTCEKSELKSKTAVAGDLS